jgi:hypothetical protein
VGEHDEELVLPLSKISYLFNPPAVEPLSSSPAEVLGISGIEYLLKQLHMNKTRRRAHTLAILLPAGECEPANAERVMQALHRHAQVRIASERRELHDTHRYGWRITGIALVVLAICIGISSVFASDMTQAMRPLVRQTFEYGFEIIGWVILWHPIDVLVFTPLPIRYRIAALLTLANIHVAIREDRAQADALSS